MNEKINLTKSDGTSVTGDIICFLENNSGKRYVYYTLNETVGAGANSTVKIYVSKVAQNNPALDTPIDDSEWDTLKGYMSDALKGNADTEIKYLPISELSNPTSISERAIAMPISYDYINKHRGIYAQNVANVATTETAPVTEAAAAPVVEETPVTSEAVVEPTPVVPETPNVFDAPTPEAAPAPTVEPVTPVAPSVEPASEPVAAVEQPAEEDNGSDDTGSNGGAATLTPINIDEIEKKYSEMIETINKLKEQELEAAKRYNATIELSAMHTEQHANYVQSEQSKEVAAEIPVAETAPVTEPVSPQAVETQPAGPTPVVPEQPAAPAGDSNVETNWFDMPSN